MEGSEGIVVESYPFGEFKQAVDDSTGIKASDENRGYVIVDPRNKGNRLRLSNVGKVTERFCQRTSNRRDNDGKSPAIDRGGNAFNLESLTKLFEGPLNWLRCDERRMSVEDESDCRRSGQRMRELGSSN